MCGQILYDNNAITFDDNIKSAFELSKLVDTENRREYILKRIDNEVFDICFSNVSLCDVSFVRYAHLPDVIDPKVIFHDVNKNIICIIKLTHQNIHVYTEKNKVYADIIIKP